MRNLTQHESRGVSGGTACDQNEPTGEKVKDVLNDGLEKVGEGVDTISDKIHDVVDHHNQHHKDYTPKKYAI